MDVAGDLVVGITDVGIARSLLGVRGRTLRWERIVAVRCGVVDLAPTQSTSVYVFQSRKYLWPFTCIMVLPSINESDELSALLFREVENRGIPIKGWRRNRLVIIDRLPRLSKVRSQY